MIQLTAPALRAMFPRAPSSILEALLAGQGYLDQGGVTATRQRLSFCLANVAHETSGFTIPHLTESIAYSASRACQVWPTRFNSPAHVYAKVGANGARDPQLGAKIVDVVYGGRMGNRPGTHDGSRYIGRGALQLTGRAEYREIGRACGLGLEDDPELACVAENQARIIGAYWEARRLSRFADAGDFVGCVRAINGGTIGLAEREKYLARFVPIIKSLPGAPPTSAPPANVINAAADKERRAAAAGAVAGGAGTAGSLVQIDTKQANSASSAALSPLISFALIGLGLAVLVVAAIALVKKRATVIASWF
jgi:predicted chitinase